MKIFLAVMLLIILSYFAYHSSRPTDVPSAPPVAQTGQPAQPAESAQPPLATQPPPVAESTPAPKPAPTRALFQKPVEPGIFELSSGALVLWRNFADQKPALVLFSTHPFLDPLGAAEQEAIVKFVKTATPAELVRRSRLNAPDTIFVPPQTVSAAIESGMIGELVFVQPTTREVEKFSLVNFQKRAFAAGFLNEKEALALTLKDGIISGTVRGIPFRCVHPETLPQIDRPVIVHVDLGYFMDVYINDVKTPMYNLLYQTARSIRDAGWQALAATLSFSNQEAEFSLDTRFIISDLAVLLLHPELLEGGTPPSWELRSNARLASAMFDETTASELTAKAVAVAPDDPAALYALSQRKFVERQPDEAFALLDRAVALDPGYALAYVDLGETALATGREAKAEELLKKAIKYFPNNPFIRITLADLLIQTDRSAEALPLIRKLQQLPWSLTAHPGVPPLLKEMAATAIEQSKIKKS